MSEIGEKLKLMCDNSNSQDMKLLLLASLVDERFLEISRTQEDLKEGINETNKNISNLITLVEKYTTITNECPISQNKDAVKTWMYILKHPKTFWGIFIIFIGILIIAVSTGVIDWLKIL